MRSICSHPPTYQLNRTDYEELQRMTMALQFESNKKTTQIQILFHFILVSRVE
jgi:hypothetical protein